MSKWKPTVPYKFQARNVRTVHEKFNGVAIIGDDMGLGKSLQAIIYARDYLPTPGPIVVVCPKNIKENWRRECWKHARIRATVLDGNPKPGQELPPCTDGVYVLNYDILGKVLPAGAPDRPHCWGAMLQDLRPALVVLDEIHYVKNPNAKRTKNVKELCRGVPHKLGLGGTAGMQQRPAELWPVLHMFRPDVFKSAWTFYGRYCDLRRTPWAWEAKGATNLEELHALLYDTVLVRNRKEDVLKDLPPKTRTVVPIDLPPKARKEYDSAAADYVLWLAKNKGMDAARRAAAAEELAKLTGLLLLVARLKYESGAVAEWAADAVEEGEKVLYFGNQKSILTALTDSFKGAAVLVNGDVNQTDRQVRTDRFNRDPACRAFVGQFDAAGVGWSCTAASTVAFVEMPWTPGHVAQCEDRVRGIGRGTGSPVNSYFLVARGTAEEWLCGLLEQKERTLNQILDGRDVEDFKITSRLREMLVAEYGGKKWGGKRSTSTGTRTIPTGTGGGNNGSKTARRSTPTPSSSKNSRRASSKR